MNNLKSQLDNIIDKYPTSYYKAYGNQIEFFLNNNKNKGVFKIITTKDNILNEITKILVKF